jgi:hypothetical protein
MKKFFNTMLSDSNKVSTKRFIGLICLIMFVAYGIMGLIVPFNVNFWIFYVSLCTITIWIAFKFMTSEKILKYDVIGKLSKFAPLKEAVYEAITTEEKLDGVIQPEQLSGATGTELTQTEKDLLGIDPDKVD